MPATCGGRASSRERQDGLRDEPSWHQVSLARSILHPNLNTSRQTGSSMGREDHPLTSCLRLSDLIDLIANACDWSNASSEPPLQRCAPRRR
jgi:hypothetical protein